MWISLHLRAGGKEVWVNMDLAYIIQDGQSGGTEIKFPVGSATPVIVKESKADIRALIQEALRNDE
jgi:hypothetical protein